jgi:hypothetical protein
LFRPWNNLILHSRLNTESDMGNNIPAVPCIAEMFWRLCRYSEKCFNKDKEMGI